MIKKTKIARVATIPFAFISLKHLFSELSSRDDIELHLITSKGYFLDNLAKDFPEIKIHVVPICREINIKEDIKCLIKLIKIFKQEKYHIVHSHTPKAGLLAMMGALLSGIKNRNHTFTGQVWANYRGFKRKLFILIDKLIALMATRVYADGFSQSRILINEMVVDGEKIKVLGNGSFAGIDVKKFSMEKVKKNSDELRRRIFPEFDGKIILFLGRLNEDKGVSELLDAFEITKKNYKVKLLIVGPEDKLSEALKNKIELAKSDADICFLDFVVNTEDYIGACDIFCLPSYREGCPTSVIEASAMGKTILVSRIYGTEDIVKDNETGIFFEAKNVQDLTNKLKYALENEDEIKIVERNAKEFAVDNFSMNLLSSLMINEYEQQVRKKL